MKQKKSLHLLLFFFTGAAFLVGTFWDVQAQKRWDEIDFPPLNEFERPEPEIFELENGIRFYLLPDEELPLINLHLLVRTGGVLVPDEKTGLETLTGRVMRTGGSEEMTGEELDELLENRAARFETSIGFTSGTARMDVLKEDFDELLPLFVDMLVYPALPEEKLNLAKTQQKSLISRRNDNQSQVAQREFRRLIYGADSRYGRMKEYDTIDAITREDLVDFHSRSFVGENMMIGVIGDFDSTEMKRKLTSEFGAVPAGSELEMDFPEVNYDWGGGGAVHFIDKPDVNQSYILLGHIGGVREHPDYPKLQVMNRLLSGGFSGRLFQVVRSERGLAYSVFGSYESNYFYPGIFTAGVMTRSSETSAAIQAVVQEIRRLQEETAEQEELDRTIDRFLNSLVFQYDSRLKILQQRMVNDYAGLPPDALDQLVEEVRDVTVEDVQKAARTWLRPDRLQILIVGNREEIGDQLEVFGKVNEIELSIP